MNHSIHNTIVNFVWGIADDVLRDVYVRSKYRDVILPMTVIRRLDALLEPTKEAVLGMKKQLDGARIANQHAALCQASGEAFCNVSPFTLRDLKNRAMQQQLKADFEVYLDGFSPNVEIEDAAPVLRRVHKPGKATSDPIHGLFEAEVNGKTCVVEYEPDTALRDSEQKPLLEEGGIEAFFRREVLPYTPDAWIDLGKTQVGYEISFTRHFYRPAPMRTLDQIKADIYALEQETEGLLEQIVGEAE